MQSYSVMRDALSHYYSSHTDRRHEIELESKYHQVNECITTLVSSCEKLISMHATSFPLDEKQVWKPFSISDFFFSSSIPNCDFSWDESVCLLREFFFSSGVHAISSAGDWNESHVVWVMEGIPEKWQQLNINDVAKKRQISLIHLPNVSSTPCCWSLNRSLVT